MAKGDRHTRAGLGWLVSQAPGAPRNSLPARPSSNPPRDFFSKAPPARNPYVSERPTDPVVTQKGRPGMIQIPAAAPVPSDVPVPMRNRGLGTSQSPAPRSELPRPGWQLSSAPPMSRPSTSSIPAPRKKQRRQNKQLPTERNSSVRPKPRAKPKRRTATSGMVRSQAPSAFVDAWDQFGFWASVFAWFLCVAAFVLVDAAAPETWQTRNSTFLDPMLGVSRRTHWDMRQVHWAQLLWFLTALGAGVGLMIRNASHRRRGDNLPRSLIGLVSVSLLSLFASLFI